MSLCFSAACLTCWRHGCQTTGPGSGSQALVSRSSLVGLTGPVLLHDKNFLFGSQCVGVCFFPTFRRNQVTLFPVQTGWRENLSSKQRKVMYTAVSRRPCRRWLSPLLSRPLSWPSSSWNQGSFFNREIAAAEYPIEYDMVLLDGVAILCQILDISGIGWSLGVFYLDATLWQCS